ncbi:MAG: hypothetical protein ACTHN5_07645 [Phycisphaerae bacterium]
MRPAKETGKHYSERTGSTMEFRCHVSTSLEDQQDPAANVEQNGEKAITIDLS